MFTSFAFLEFLTSNNVTVECVILSLIKIKINFDTALLVTLNKILKIKAQTRPRFVLNT
jgi:hypothetical protein